MEEDKVKYKKCSKCSTPFTCNDSGASCWCNNHQLSQEQLRFLKENYDNCLCEGCLSQFGSENK